MKDISTVNANTISDSFVLISPKSKAMLNVTKRFIRDAPTPIPILCLGLIKIGIEIGQNRDWCIFMIHFYFI